MTPKGFLASGWNVGIKDDTLDFGSIHSSVPASAGCMFTRNNFPGNPVIVGREHAKSGRLQTIVVNSKNSNVATGPDGLKLARQTCVWTAEALGTKPELVLPSSTGVIGRPMPEEKIRAACQSLKAKLTGADFDLFSRAIMTTDTRPKLRSVQLKSGITITACAKGSGMIEPNMATMLAYAATDASITPEDLQRLVRCAVDRTFNRVSVDSDTSTSDTFVCLANGASNVAVNFSNEAADAWNHGDLPVPEKLPGLNRESEEFALGFGHLCLELAREIARDGEGATKLIEVQVTEARDRQQAVKIARSIVNSPLVKTAVYGADPNWGRLVMAVGKVFDEPVPIENLKIFFGDQPLRGAGPDALKTLSAYLKNREVTIRVSLGTGRARETVWGCDLTQEYVHINADYTT